jgi:hypothetical protein
VRGAGGAVPWHVEGGGGWSYLLPPTSYLLPPTTYLYLLPPTPAPQNPNPLPLTLTPFSQIRKLVRELKSEAKSEEVTLTLTQP